PFFALTLVAQAVYVVGLSWLDLAATQKPLLARFNTWLRDRRLWYFGLAVLGALLLYAPWIWVLLDQQTRASATTDWTRVSVGLLYLAKLWLLSFTALWVDLDFGFNNPFTSLLRLPVLLLILVAFYRLLRQPLRVWLFLYTAAWVPFLLLALPDLVLGGKRSAVSRYLISCFPAVQLAVAHLFSSKLFGNQLDDSIPPKRPTRRLWLGLLGFVFAASILSCSVSARAQTWWNKDLSYFNAEVIGQVNRATAEAKQAGTALPILLSDMGDDYTNMGDLVAMSYSLRPETRLFLVSAQPNFAPIAQAENLLVFRASKPLEAAIAQQGWRLIPVSEQARLWRVVR
ncbi:MAG: glycosyl transferase family 39, partial [Elainella sp.]